VAGVFGRGTFINIVVSLTCTGKWFMQLLQFSCTSIQLSFRGAVGRGWYRSGNSLCLDVTVMRLLLYCLFAVNTPWDVGDASNAQRCKQEQTTNLTCYILFAKMAVCVKHVDIDPAGTVDKL
jgi:hypothetical protein